MKNLLGLIITLTILLCGIADAQVATGGAFALEQSVVAGGGGQSAGGAFTVNGTTAQAVAGMRSVEAAKSLHGGFWNAAPLAPTAANVSIGGRVLTAEGQGIRSVSVTLTESDGTVRTATTGSFGHYNFAEIRSGQIVSISVSAKRFTFAQSTIVLSVTENAGGIDFTAAANY